MASPPVTPFNLDQHAETKLPQIGKNDAFVDIVKSLSIFFVDEIHLPSTFEQLRTTTAGHKIRVLVEHLVANVTNPAIINALLTLKWHFSTLEPDERGINETRANSCEIVAWRFLSRISERDAVDYCLYELPRESPELPDALNTPADSNPTESSSLLPQFRPQEPITSVRPTSKRGELLRSVSNMGGMLADMDGGHDEEDPTTSFIGLNGLEIAAVADCKKFLSQRIVQKIVTGIWRGDIVFWESLSPSTKKKAQFYNQQKSDPFTRLRVPRYIKAFEVLFFATFLVLYYAVLVERNPYRITPIEVFLYVWFAAFAYDELGEFIDAGSIFYAVDIWNGCDLIIIVIGVAFLFTRVIGLLKNSDDMISTAFDILSLEALFMVPRICSLLSLHPYFGTLIPCLKAMVKDFVKFMAVVAVLYIGFLTTFTLLARDHFTLADMIWILIKVFFGSSYLGFDIMNDINPKLGPPLMLIFVCMTHILLITSLISILSASFSRVIAHAREEYLFVYSVYVLEASTSNRLTHFYPPLNLIPLVLIRPLRLCISSEGLRRERVTLLKLTHMPIVAVIWVFETIHSKVKGEAQLFSIVGPSGVNTLPFDGANSPRRQMPFLSNRGKTYSQHFPEVPGDDGAHSPGPQYFAIKSKKEGRAETVFVDNSALEKKVDDMNAKIAELTALIMAQQSIPNAEE